MLKIISGSFYSNASLALREEIKDKVLNKKHAILIVPEQQTVAAEGEMAMLLSENAPLFFEVTNFTRLANSVFRSLGGIDKEYCDGAKKALIMWRTLTELSPALSMTDGRREINYGMVKRALSALGEADSLTIDANALMEAKKEIGENDRLCNKINDLALITSLYKKLLSEKYADTGEDVSEAVKRLADSPSHFSGTAVFVEGFTSFTEPQYALIGLLTERCDVTVLLDVTKSREDAFEFCEPQDTRKRLAAIANKAGVEAKLVRYDGRFNARTELTVIHDLLWQTFGKIDDPDMKPEESTFIYEAASPYEACDFVVADIKKKVLAGASFSDFAIVAANADKYVGILDVSAKRAGVPIFVSAKSDVSSYEAIKLIYAALRCVTGDFQREDVISYAKCGLSSISRDDCDKFEMYAHTWQINGKRFYDGILWNMNPDGYSDTRKPKNDELLLELNEIRNKLILPIASMKVRLGDSTTVQEYTKALYEFLTEINLEDALLERAEILRNLGEADLAEENERLYKIICNSLDTLVEASGAEESDLDAFIARLKIVFASASVAKIPSFCDTVTVGSADIVRMSRKKHVYMLGVNKGEFPSISSDEGYFTERDKAKLFEAGLPFMPTDDEKRARGLYSFSRAFSYASESISLVYTNKNADFSATKRADVITRILDVCNGDVKIQKISDVPAWDMIYSTEDALESIGKFDGEDYNELCSLLRDFGKEDVLSVAEGKLANDNLELSSNSLDSIYGRDLMLSQSKIDLYNTCPLAYFCRYDLNLSEGERAEFDARNIGSFIHAILENFFIIQSESGVPLSEIGEEVQDEFTKKAAEIYLDKLFSQNDVKTKRTTLLLNRLVTAAKPIITGLCEEFSNSQYQPRYFELRIGGRGERDPELLTFCDEDGKRTLIKGSIDRVDTFKCDDNVYVRVIDYKTGQKDFNRKDLEEGKNLQMFLYLRAVIDTKNKKLLEDIGVTNDGRLIPAGVLYVKSDLADVKISHASADEEATAVKSSQKRQGMLLDDPTSINAMDINFLPIKINKNGSYHKDSIQKLYSEEEWQTLSEIVESSVKKVTSKMRSGNIHADPMRKKNASPCEYCKFKPICRNAKIK